MSGRAKNMGGVTTCVRLMAVAFSIVATSLALSSGAAFAAFSHSTVETTFSGGPECNSIEDIAVVESTETVYVVCDLPPKPPRLNRLNQVIRKFDLDGNPVSFTAEAPYINGNEITESPTNPARRFGEPRIAVDNSGANNGYLFVVEGSPGSEGGPNVDIFKPSGEWADFIPPAPVVFAPNFGGVDVAPDGSIYVFDTWCCGPLAVTRYDTLFRPIERAYTLESGAFGRVDSSGAVWVRQNDSGFGFGRVMKYEVNQFTTNIKVLNGASPALIAAVQAFPSPFVNDPLLETGGNLDLDLSDDDLYVNRGNRIETYSAGHAVEAAHRNAPDFGLGTLTGSKAVAVTSDHRVYASNGGGTVVRFGPGDILPDIRTPQPQIDDIGHTEVTVRGEVELAGGSDITDCEVQYGKDTTYSGPGSGTVPCSPDPSGAPPGSNFDADTEVSAAISGLTMGQTYHYRFKAANEKGENRGIDRTVVPAYVLKVKTLAPADVNDRGATLRGSFDPDGIETSYRFEYGVDTSYGGSTAEVNQGSEAGEILVETALDDLPAGKTIHYRIAASNEHGTTYGADRFFKTAAAPDIAGVRASEVTASSALLHARIDPVGYPSQYHFEYGPTPEYGISVPTPAEEIGSSNEPVEVSQRIEGLQSGVTYHFRVVATNKWGSASSADTTFDFAPPACPNDHVRQQTGSSYLPDCRAYELVSPAVAGSVQFFPSNAAWDRGGRWALNTGLATSPSRFSFFGGLGAVNGIDAPNSEIDMYMATRTTSGWVTTLPGLTGSQTESGGRAECSESMHLCIDHDEGYGGITQPQNAPYLFTFSGKPLGRLPTNVKVVPGGENFDGAQRMSGDFSHFVFSATDVSFAPGGVVGGQGSAYDNDIGDRTVTIVSKLPSGDDIPQDGTTFHEIEFPGLSTDGSHILMLTPAANGKSHLYLRVGRALTYDVARGAGVDLVGMTRDGSQVLFIATQQLTEGDTDESADLYRWSEQGDTLTRLSKGNGQGDSDECNATWVAGCGVAALETERGNPDGRQSVPGLDDQIADGSGDVYFYSPELLDSTRRGLRNQRNLYVHRNGEVRLVATLDAGTEINRMQISPDGDHAAMVTDSRLTSYDNDGFKQMYAYDADGGQLRCASCNPSGLPPTADIEASQGGAFMADDGRAFFATKDSLVPRDINGEIIDVYEYVGGGPQLITSGTAARDFTGGGLATFGGPPQHTGLEAVSANGGDVYFSTFDSLVPQDQNGPYVKIYNARTGGGFPLQPALAPCAAADECHGPDSSAPAAPTIASSAALGGGDNARAPRRAGARRKAERKRAAKRKRAKRLRAKRKRAMQRRSRRGHRRRSVRRENG